MCDLVKYQDQIGAVVNDNDPDYVRYIDQDHVVYQIERSLLELFNDNDIWYYKVKGDPIQSFYYDNKVEEACCSLARYLNNT